MKYLVVVEESENGFGAYVPIYPDASRLQNPPWKLST